jgi:hypothetical protein
MPLMLLVSFSFFNIKLYGFNLDCDVAFANVRWPILRMYHEISERFTHNILAIAVAQLPPPLLQILDILSLLYRLNGQNNSDFLLLANTFKILYVLLMMV